MNIFQTAMISQVLFGAGARHSIGQTLTNMGAKKALIVTDKFLHDSGLSNDVELPSKMQVLNLLCLMVQNLKTRLKLSML